MDYSLLLAVHNITEEMKAKQTLPLLPMLASSDGSSTENQPTLTSRSVLTSSSMQDETATISKDSGIAMNSISNLPTYMQYLRVVEFIRAQQGSSLINTDPFALNNHQLENTETASITTVKPELSPSIEMAANAEGASVNHAQSRGNPLHPVTSLDIPSTFQSASTLIGGDIWYNRQNLSRLTM